MKTRKMYQVRFFDGSEYSKQIGRKLVDRTRANKIVKFLKGRGFAAFIAPLTVSC